MLGIKLLLPLTVSPVHGDMSSIVCCNAFKLNYFKEEVQLLLYKCESLSHCSTKHFNMILHV